MAARIVHFGGDGCNRLAILESAGYEVEDCGSLPELVAALNHPSDAVVITELGGDPNESVVERIRECCSAPIILFQSLDCRCSLGEFDVVIPNLTPPRSWLDKISATIEGSRVPRAERRILTEESARLLFESAVARSRSARERSRTHPAPGRNPPASIPNDR